jgi:hypothetical protein
LKPIKPLVVYCALIGNTSIKWKQKREGINSIRLFCRFLPRNWSLISVVSGIKLRLYWAIKFKCDINSFMKASERDCRELFGWKWGITGYRETAINGMICWCNVYPSRMATNVVTATKQQTIAVLLLCFLSYNLLRINCFFFLEVGYNF